MKRTVDIKCTYPHYTCSRSKYRDYNYCFKHVLEDSSSPFAACQYLSKFTQRRCHKPASKYERNAVFSACELHKCVKARTPKQNTKSQIGISGSPKNVDGSSYMAQAVSVLNTSSLEFEESKGNKQETVETDHEMQKNDKWLVKNSFDWKLTESDLDVGISIGRESLLDKSFVVTAEEALILARDNLVQMQALYIDQFKQLHKELLEKRHLFLTDKLNVHPDGMPSNVSTNLTALNGFRCFVEGEHYMLLKQAKQKRDEVSGNRRVSTDTFPRCCHVSRSIRCRSPCLPYTKFCVLHIVEDPLQIMFKSCSYPSCKAPVSLLTVTDNSSIERGKISSVYCKLHDSLPCFQQCSFPVTAMNKSVLTNKDENFEPAKMADDSVKVFDVKKTEDQQFCELRNNSCNVEKLSNAHTSQILQEVDKKDASTGLEKFESIHAPAKKRSSHMESSSSIDDLQPGQCYVMQSLPCQHEPELCLQLVKGIGTDGSPEIGDGVVFKQHLSHVGLGGISEFDKTRICPEENPNKAVLSLHSSETCAKIKHHGSYMSVSVEPSDRVPNSMPLSCTTPPLDVFKRSESHLTQSIKVVDASDCDTACELSDIVQMPPLVPLRNADQRLSKLSHSDDKNLANSSEPSGLVIDSENEAVCTKSSMACDMVSNIQIDPNESGSHDSMQHNRKPSCPDEETAVASLLSLCSATCSPDNLSDCL